MEKTYSTADGRLGTPNILVQDRNIATWTTYDVDYNQEHNRIIIKGRFDNNTDNFIARVKSMEFNIILLDDAGNYLEIFWTKFGGHEINIKPNGLKNYTYIVKGIPYSKEYAGNYHITYCAQYSVRRSIFSNK